MRRGVIRVGLVPVLGGFALALAMVALVVREAQAETACERCTKNASARAKQPGGACYGVHPYAQPGCIEGYVMNQCYGKGKPCAGTDPAPSSVTCAGYLQPGDCPNQSVGICTNETWNVNCEANTTKKCQDTQTLPQEKQVLPSVCYWTCTCKQ